MDKVLVASNSHNFPCDEINRQLEYLGEGWEIAFISNNIFNVPSINGLSQHLKYVITVIVEKKRKKTSKRNIMLSRPISELNLSVRARNNLMKLNISTIGELTKLREEDYLRFKNSDQSLEEIKRELDKLGFKLKAD